MLKEIFLFELKYRSRRPATYIYLGLSFLLAFLIVASPTLEIPPLINPNSPYFITLLLVVISLFFTLINSAIIGASIIRDFDHNMDSLVFSTAVSKWHYLFGRFAGSFFVLVIINLAAVFGVFIAFALGNYLPWEIYWSDMSLQPTRIWYYIQPFLLFSLPNLFITSALFFMTGALGRNMVIIYTQGMVFIVLYQLAAEFFKDMNSRYLAAVFDPLGVQAFLFHTQYWTPAEQNNQLIPLEGAILYNRILWVMLAAAALLLTYLMFSFKVSIDKRRQPAPIMDEPLMVRLNSLPDFLPAAVKPGRYTGQFSLVWKGAIFYFNVIRKEVTFIAIAVSGLLLLITKAFNVTEMYGASSYPTTAVILTLLDSYNLFFILIAIIYAGDLIWKERQLKVAGIVDSLPINDFVNVLSKFFGLALVYVVLFALLIIGGILIQSAYGYYNYELSAYLSGLFGQTFVNLIFITIISFSIQILINNKFIGYVACIVFFLINTNLARLGFENLLWQFGSGSLGTFSDMNKFGHFVPLFVWLKTYWLSLLSIIFILTIAFTVRGNETHLIPRWKTGKKRFSHSLAGLVVFAGVIAVFSGSTIFYNTNLLNEFESSRNGGGDKNVAEEPVFQLPEVIESNVRVDLYPANRDFTLEGFYYLKNTGTNSLTKILVSLHPDKDLRLEYLRFNKMFSLADDGTEENRYRAYELEDPLAAGDSIQMSFRMGYTTAGFKGSQENTDIVYNGTYLDNSYFPSIGYRLVDTDTGSNTDTSAGNLHKARLETTVSTDADQLALAPGRLIDTWMENDRRFFHYKENEPVPHSYAITSGRYQTAADKWKEVNLEIYHHPDHRYNIPRMLEGMKDALDFNTNNFGPYPYEQLRIIEFPGYTSHRATFAGTIPFSERLAFILKVNRPSEDLDVTYYLTAHEVAHQWWGQQVTPANTGGKYLVTEGLAQYCALMVLKKTLPKEAVQRFLKYEMDQYLAGRSKEQRKENPLVSVGDQSYIYYNKAALAFYLLQDFIGEEAVNSALRSFKDEWSDTTQAQPDSKNLLGKIENATPDSLQYLLHDLFEAVTIYENKSSYATYLKRPDGRYEVQLSFSSKKYQVDSLGNEKSMPLNDWVDVGVFTQQKGGEKKWTYLEKKKITKEENVWTVIVDHLPLKAGIDPLNKFIDRNSGDNVVDAQKPDELNSLPF